MAKTWTDGDVGTRNVIQAHRHMGVDEAAGLMRAHHVGALLVVDDTGLGPAPVGMLTDRDIVTCIVSKKLDPAMLQVEDAMSRPFMARSRRAVK